MASGRGRAYLVGALVGTLAAVCPVAEAFHGCENGGDNCRDDDTVIVCLPQSECHFDGEGKQR